MDTNQQTVNICLCGHELRYHYGYGTKSPCRRAACKCKDYSTKEESK